MVEFGGILKTSFFFSSLYMFQQLKCQWLKTGQFFLSSVTYNLAWDPQDNRLLTATDSIQLWAPPGSDILEEEEEVDNKVPPVLNDWKCIWQCKLVSKSVVIVIH